MSTKTIYLHENGNLVIWGKSEFFESSHLVKKQYRIDEAVADSEDFREIVSLFNEQAEVRKKQDELIALLEENKKEIESVNSNRLNLIRYWTNKIGYFSRKSRENIIEALGIQCP